MSESWVRWGFGPQLIPFSATLPFVIDYSKAVPSNIPSVTLAQAAARQIATDARGDVTLILSGGVDSQALAYAFKTAGVKSRNISVRYKNGFNDHDIFSSDFYKTHGIEVEVIEIDIVAFHEEEIFSWANDYQCNSPHILSHMKIASLFPAATVVSSGCLVSRSGNIGWMNYSVFGLQRFSEITKQDVRGFFFATSSPELMASFVQTSERPEVLRSNLYEWKVATYRAAGYPVIAQAAKYHGFELLKEFYDGHQVDQKTRLLFKDKPSSRPYDLLFRHPLERQVPYSKIGEVIFDPPRS